MVVAGKHWWQERGAECERQRRERAPRVSVPQGSRARVLVVAPPRSLSRRSLQRDELHPVKGVCHVVRLLVAQRNQQPVRHKLDVLPNEQQERGGAGSVGSSGSGDEVAQAAEADIRSLAAPSVLPQPLRHQAAVHADEVHWQRVAHKLLLDLHSFAHDRRDALLGQLVVQQAACARASVCRGGGVRVWCQGQPGVATAATSAARPPRQLPQQQGSHAHTHTCTAGRQSRCADPRRG